MGQPLRVLFDLARSGRGPREPLEVPLRLLREWRRHLPHSLPLEAGSLLHILLCFVHKKLGKIDCINGRIFEALTIFFFFLLSWTFYKFSYIYASATCFYSLLLLGMPLFFMEMALGQYAGQKKTYCHQKEHSRLKKTWGINSQARFGTRYKIIYTCCRRKWNLFIITL